MSYPQNQEEENHDTGKSAFIIAFVLGAFSSAIIMFPSGVFLGWVIFRH